MYTTVWRLGAIAAAVLAAVPQFARAQVFGSLDNFDVVNTTGHTAYDFEIEVEDVSCNRRRSMR